MKEFSKNPYFFIYVDSGNVRIMLLKSNCIHFKTFTTISYIKSLLHSCCFYIPRKQLDIT